MATTASEKPIGKLVSTKEIERLFDFQEDLGTGTFSTVKKAINRETNEPVAIKVINKKDLGENRDAVAAEVQIHKKIKHPNIVQLYDIYETPQKIFLIMELVTGGELFDRIIASGHFSEAEASEAVGCVVRAVKYLHDLGIVHRDLKPENLLLSKEGPDAVIKIADFGLSSMKDKKYMTTVCGTPGYVAPEVLTADDTGGYGREVDLWSIGVILYILLCGFQPFYDENNAALFMAIKRGAFDFPSPYWDDISDSVKGLVRGLLTVDPRARMTTDQVLAHPWISEGTASTRPLPDWVLDKMSLLSKARMRLRKAILTTIAANRFKAKETVTASDVAQVAETAGL